MGEGEDLTDKGLGENSTVGSKAEPHSSEDTLFCF